MNKSIRLSNIMCHFQKWLVVVCLGLCVAYFASVSIAASTQSDTNVIPSEPKLLQDPPKPLPIPIMWSSGMTQGVSSKEVEEDTPSTTIQPRLTVATWTFAEETMPPWQRIEKGLDVGLFPALGSVGQSCNIVILRVNPVHFGFALYATSATDSPSMSLGDWAAQKNLALAINASMYLPDEITSTGYLRVFNHTNNKRIASNFGAFFVAGPRENHLPAAQVLDRQTDTWEKTINQYDMVVQNYRMINSERQLLWQAGGPLHAISALARAADGALLFIHCPDPISGLDFASLILALPYEINVLMYLEGGPQAGLILRSPVMHTMQLGENPLAFWTQNNSISRLPNIIGVYRKTP